MGRRAWRTVEGKPDDEPRRRPMTNWIDKAKDFITGHPEEAKDAVEKVEDLLNEKTGGKYSERIDQGSDALSEQFGLPADPEDQPAPPSDATPSTPEPTGPSSDTGSETGSDTGSDTGTGTTPGTGDMPDLPTDPGTATGLPRTNEPELFPGEGPEDDTAPTADAPPVVDDPPATDTSGGQPSPDLTPDDPPVTTSNT